MHQCSLSLLDQPEKPSISSAPFQVQNHTYQLVLKDNTTWMDARNLCSERKMELASVADALQQAVLTVNVSRLGKPLWIGLYSDDVSAFEVTSVKKNDRPYTSVSALRCCLCHFF